MFSFCWFTSCSLFHWCQASHCFWSYWKDCIWRHGCFLFYSSLWHSLSKFISCFSYDKCLKIPGCYVSNENCEPWANKLAVVLISKVMEKRACQFLRGKSAGRRTVFSSPKGKLSLVTKVHPSTKLRSFLHRLISALLLIIPYKVPNLNLPSLFFSLSLPVPPFPPSPGSSGSRQWWAICAWLSFRKL